jgi:uncharacterized protein (DUF2141 family)
MSNTIRVSARLYTHFALLLATLCPIVPANAAVGWNEVSALPGALTTDINGQQEILGQASIAWYGDPNNQPQVNTVYYVRISWGVTGNPYPAGGANVAPELFLPAGSTLAISAANPVTCFAVHFNTTPATFTQAIPECPQVPTTGLKGGLAFRPVPLMPPPPGGNPVLWPSAQGTGWEIHVPILSTMPLSGIITNSPCTSCLTAAVQFNDGYFNPWAFPTVGVTVHGPPAMPSITYPSPSATNVTSTSARVTAHLDTAGTTGTAFFEDSATPPSSSTCRSTRTNIPISQSSVPLGVFIDLTSLPAGMDRYWRMCYTTGGTTYIGSTQSFRTAGLPPPRINAISPATALPGDSVTITGTDLTGATSVVLRGNLISASATIANKTATAVTFTVPNIAFQTVSVSVTTPGGTATATSALTVGIDTILDNIQVTQYNVAIHFHSTTPAPLAQFDCRLDSGPTATTCDAGVVNYYNLSPGRHSVEITAHASGFRDSTPLIAPFTIMRVRPPLPIPFPQTTLLTGPSGSVNTNTATFTFKSNDAESTFECSQSPNGGWVPCSSPHTLKGLPAGMNFFAVRAKDADGNVDTAPATTTFTVDPLPLETVLLTSFPGPDVKTTTSRTASFSFQSKNGVGFQCSVDYAAWAPCEGPVFLDGLAAGPHTFLVRAVDSDGNADLSPATKSWTIE